MKIFPMFIVLIILGNLVSYIYSSFIKTRTWHEEFTEHGEDVKRSVSNHRNLVLYPRYKRCVAPREKPEKLKQRAVQVQTKTTDTHWSGLLGIYTTDSGAEIYNWNFWKHTVDPKISTRWHQLTSIAIFLGLFIFIFTVFVSFVPIAGKAGYTFYSFMWLVTFHPEIRRLIRRLLITQEKLTRRSMQFLLTKAGDKTKSSKRPFRLPFIFREYDDEEVPTELVVTEDDSEGGDVSSDAFENLLTTKTKPDKDFAKEAKSLRNFIANVDNAKNNQSLPKET